MSLVLLHLQRFLLLPCFVIVSRFYSLSGARSSIFKFFVDFKYKVWTKPCITISFLGSWLHQSNMSEVWELLAKNAADDKVVMKMTYETKFYGISAYHCQQCLEKIIKAIILKTSFSNNDAKKLGHRPLSNMWNEFVKKFVDDVKKRREYMKEREKEMEEWSDDIKQLEAYSILILLRDTSKNISDIVVNLAPQVMEKKTSSTFKKLWWKWSLGVSFINNEKIQWNDIFKFYNENPILFSQQNIENMKPHTITKNKTISQYQQHDNTCISFCMNMFEQFKNSYVNSPNTNNSYFGKFPKLLDSLIFLMPIHNCVFPYEDLGRYAQIIDGKSTTEWYQIKKIELKLLENHVSKIFDYLEQTCLK